MEYNISNSSPDVKSFLNGESLTYSKENIQCSLCERKIKAFENFYSIAGKTFCCRYECAKYAKQAILKLVEDDYIYEN